MSGSARRRVGADVRTEASHSMANTVVVVCASPALTLRAGAAGSDTASTSSNVSL